MIGEFWVSASTTLGLVFLAELGDKTQLVCMTLAARHPAPPVLLGAVLAFMVLNLLAVLFGAVFALFGLQALRAAGAEDADAVEERSGRSVLLSTFGLIFLAELGDKTQLAVAGLAGTQPALPVWVGGTLALALASALGVLAGQTLLRRLPMSLLHRFSGIFFLLLAVLAGWKAVAALTAAA